MLGLGSYESSGDEEEHEASLAPDLTASTDAEEAHRNITPKKENTDGEDIGHAFPPAIGQPGLSCDGHTIGPVVGPPGPPSSPTPVNGATSRSQSPYSSNRALLHDLTLPAYPNLDIPPSPPASPPTGMNEKFAHFLELKKRGVHFNDKLAKSSALKNPSLLHKLMGFVAIDDQAQYASTLPKDLWDTTSFPPWAYKEQLARAQQETLKKKEEQKARKQREALDFVSESASATSSRGGTPNSMAGRSGWRGSAAERVMAGLDRDKPRSPVVVDTLKRKNFDRGSRNQG